MTPKNNKTAPKLTGLNVKSGVRAGDLLGTSNIQKKHISNVVGAP